MTPHAAHPGPGQGLPIATTEDLRIGVVVIGRNEGERLLRCLGSVPPAMAARVYVDSDSRDGSVTAALAHGWDVVALTGGPTLTAARGRNEGFRRLEQVGTAVDAVQFIDGDCELVEGWIACAAQFLRKHPEVAAVCGRRRERHPEASLFNRLCDLEWNTPVGMARAFGGDVMVRASAFRASGGYCEALIAGEDPELALRLRQAGHRIWRLEAEMTKHDAAMFRWTQWWQRNRRAGFASAAAAALHGSTAERHGVAEMRRAWIWGGFLPCALALCMLLQPGWVWAAGIYPLQALRVGWKLKRAGRESPWLQATMFVLGRFPEAHGCLDHAWASMRGRQRHLIEYK